MGPLSPHHFPSGVWLGLFRKHDFCDDGWLLGRLGEHDWKHGQSRSRSAPGAQVSENLYFFIQQRFPQDLSKTFLETEQGVRFSYRDLEQETARYARLLTKLGLTKGDRVLAQVDKSPQALLLCLASIRAGLVYLPLYPAYR